MKTVKTLTTRYQSTTDEFEKFIYETLGVPQDKKISSVEVVAGTRVNTDESVHSSLRLVTVHSLRITTIEDTSDD